MCVHINTCSGRFWLLWFRNPPSLHAIPGAHSHAGQTIMQLQKSREGSWLSHSPCLGSSQNMGQGFSTPNKPQNCVSLTRIHKQRQPRAKHVILKAFCTESKLERILERLNQPCLPKTQVRKAGYPKQIQQNISPVPLHIKTQVSS